MPPYVFLIEVCLISQNFVLKSYLYQTLSRKTFGGSARPSGRVKNIFPILCMISSSVQKCLLLLSKIVMELTVKNFNENNLIKVTFSIPGKFSIGTLDIFNKNFQVCLKVHSLNSEHWSEVNGHCLFPFLSTELYFRTFSWYDSKPCFTVL